MLASGAARGTPHRGRTIGTPVIEVVDGADELGLQRVEPGPQRADLPQTVVQTRTVETGIAHSNGRRPIDEPVHLGEQPIEHVFDTTEGV